MIYLDNAATSWPKPVSVGESMLDCILNYCANPGRSGHKMAYLSEKKVFECREKICELLGADNPGNVVFTQNATQGLNIVIKGLLSSDKHAVVTSMEHNSVLRPLVATGAQYDVVYADKEGYVDAADVEKHIKKNTALIICTLSSNVCGSVQPFEKIAKIAHERNIPFLLDASQGLGVIDVDVVKHGIDYLAAPGHKSLLGPTGTGFVYFNSSLLPDTITEGGTGSESKLLTQPFYLPDKFESGTLNVAGISGLYEGLCFVLERSPEEIAYRENKLTNKLAENLAVLSGVKLIGYNSGKPRTAVLSLIFEKIDSMTAANLLNLEYGICVRAGFHCSYTAHCTLGTEGTGTVRISPGVFTTEAEIDKVTHAIKEIALQNNR